jgi:hypothetical protein
MAKVVERIESMLSAADMAFQGMARLKQEARLGRLQGQEGMIADIKKVGQEIQDQVFRLLHSIQFQDIARQKLERVMNYIVGMQIVMGQKLRDTGKH